MIRKSANWMEIPDERILEYLLDYGPSSPSIMAVAKGISDQKEGVQTRCERLEKEGLILRTDGDNFRITEAGTSYLDGDLDLGEDKTIYYFITYPDDNREKLRVVMPQNDFSDYCAKSDYLPSPT